MEADDVGELVSEAIEIMQGKGWGGRDEEDDVYGEDDEEEDEHIELAYKLLAMSLLKITEAREGWERLVLQGVRGAALNLMYYYSRPDNRNEERDDLELVEKAEEILAAAVRKMNEPEAAQSNERPEAPPPYRRAETEPSYMRPELQRYIEKLHRRS